MSGFAGQIIAAVDKYKTEKQHPLNRLYNHVSELEWALICQRYLVLQRLFPEKAEPLSVESLRRVDEGHKQEKIIIEDLLASGIKVYHYNPKKTVTAPEYQLICEYDASIEDDRGIVPAELKSSDPGVFRVSGSYKTASDILKSPIWYHQFYPAQMWAQIFMAKKDHGYWIFKDRSNGTIWPVETTAAEGEAHIADCLEGLNEVNKFVKNNELPDAVPCDGCKRCKMRTHCFEDFEEKSAGAGIQFITDEHLEADLARFGELKNKLAPYEKEFTELEKLEEGLKASVRGRSILCGDWSLKSSPYNRGVLDVTEEFRKEHTIKKTFWRVTIKNVGGLL